MSFDLAAVMSIQIKVGVVGQVQNRLLIAGGMIMKTKIVLFIQGIFHTDFFVAGEA